MQKRAVIYCRVSSDEQAKGCSLDFQESQLREFCQKKEIEVVEVYREDYTAKTMERPEMKKLKAKYLKKRSGTDYVLVLRWNRFSRKVQQALALIDEFKVRDVEVNAIEEWIDSKDDDAIILKTLHLSMAEADNNKRSKATRDGIHATRMKGGWSNKAPRGYINKHADELKAKMERMRFRQVDLIKLLHERGMDVSPSQVSIAVNGIGFAPRFVQIRQAIADIIEEEEKK